MQYLTLVFMFLSVVGSAQMQIDAVFSWDNDIVCFMSGEKVIKFHFSDNKVLQVQQIDEALPGLPFRRVDAALDYGNGKIYFFMADQYARFDKQSGHVDEGYPKSTADHWAGLNSDKIDAAANWSNGKSYFFNGPYYWRYDRQKESVDEGYPKQTSNTTWPGLIWTEVDAAFTHSNGKTYFFNGDEYIRFDNEKDHADEGYPKTTINEWAGLEEALKGNHPAPEPAKGLEFFHGSWEEAKAEAKRTGKLIFVDAYAVWCGPCKWMNTNTFPNKTLGSFFNKEFISVKIDMERGQGPEFGRQYPVRAYPTLFFMDANGKVVEKVTGARGAEDLLKLGQKVADQHGNKSGGEINQGGRADAYVVDKKAIDLSPYQIKSPNSVLADFMLKKGGSNYYLGFQQEHDALILTLNAQGEKVGKAIELKGYWLSDMLALADGSLAILAGKDVNNTYIEHYPNTLYFLKADKNGELSSPKHIYGGKGHSAGKSWFDGRSQGKITYNGKKFGIYFEVQKNYAEPGQKDDIHNGDMFVVTDQNGNIDEKKTHFWTASHSSTIQTAAMANGEFYTMTIGDANPYGLQVYNRDKSTSFIVWPPEEDHITYAEVNSTNAAGILRHMTEHDGDLIAFLGTVDHPNIGWKTKVDPLFLKFDKTGKVLKKKYLTQTKSTDESTISVHPIGANYLVAFGAGNVYEDDWTAAGFTLMLIDGDANTVLPATAIEEPFGTNSNLVPVNKKQFVWAYTPYNGSKSIDWYSISFK